MRIEKTEKLFSVWFKREKISKNLESYRERTVFENILGEAWKKCSIPNFSLLSSVKFEHHEFSDTVSQLYIGSFVLTLVFRSPILVLLLPVAFSANKHTTMIHFSVDTCSLQFNFHSLPFACLCSLQFCNLSSSFASSYNLHFWIFLCLPLERKVRTVHFYPQSLDASANSIWVQPRNYIMRT